MKPNNELQIETGTVTAANQQNATYSVGNQGDIGLAIGGTRFATGTSSAASVSVGQLNPHASGIKSLAAGDVLTVRSFNEGTTPTFGASGASNNFFMLARTGN